MHIFLCYGATNRFLGFMFHVIHDNYTLTSDGQFACFNVRICTWTNTRKTENRNYSADLVTV